MFCPKCGNQLNDGAAFCSKCGTKIDAAPSTPMQTAAANSEKPVKPKKGKHRVIITAIVILLLIILFFRCSGGANDGSSPRTSERGSQIVDSDIEDTASNQVIMESGDGSADTGEVYEDGSFDFEAIISQCEYCETPLNTLVEFCDLGSKYGFDEDKINACSIRKYKEMHHDCTADVIQVENVPYLYRGYCGTYSGGWKGAGPTGTGAFIGEHRLTKCLISYTGDWAYGLPEGEGELWIIKSLNYSGNDIQYVGQMSAGLRHGTGYMCEYRYSAGLCDSYRIYDESVFQNDIMAVETDAVDYKSSTGEVISYGRFIGIENGDVGMTAQWGADELSPEMKKLVNYAIIGTLAYMGYKAADGLLHANDGAGEYYDKLNQEMFADLEKSRAQKEADLIEQQEREAEEAEKTRLWNYDKYQEALYNDPDEYNWQTKNYKYNAGLGW